MEKFKNFKMAESAHGHEQGHGHHHGKQVHSPHLHHSHAHHHASGESKTRIVLGVTLVAMILEIAAGTWSGSLALLSDGWHMGTHAMALGISVLTYVLARHYAKDPRFGGSSKKFEALGAYTGAMMLGAVALALVWGAVDRLRNPTEIQFGTAMAVAVLGLLVNAVCAWILDASSPEHAHDLNLRSAYLHVLADALTSILAIVALGMGWWLGWIWLDPAVGFLAAILVGRWSIQLLRQSAVQLLGSGMES
jgi:cation diffusion facilitator family transporter